MDNELLKLMVRLQRYGLTVTGDVARSLAKLVNAALDRLEGNGTATVSDACAVQQAIGEVSNNITVQITKNVRGAVSASADISTIAAGKAFKIATLPYSPPPLGVINLISETDFAGKSWAKHSEVMTIRTGKHIADALRDGLREGESVPKIRKRVSDVSKLVAADATMLVRTSINSAANRALLKTYETNTDVIKGWRFICTLDQRTSLQCMSHSNTEWNIGEGPIPPLHPNCRSISLPITRTFRELGLDIDEPPTGQQASQNGPVPADWNYETWLRNQDTEFQRETLGPSRYDAWKNGVPLEGFASSTKPYTLNELRGSYAF